jgi:CRP-like cAMP-binding protein
VKETLTTIEKALFLKELEFFSHVPIEQAAEVAARAEEVHLEPGETIFEEGEPSKHVYLVVEGSVIAEKGGIITTVLTSGRGFGDLSLTPGGAYGITARAAGHTHVMRFSLDDFVDAMLEHPEIAVGVVRALSLRLREMGQQLADLGRELQDGSAAPPRDADSELAS